VPVCLSVYITASLAVWQVDLPSHHHMCIAVGSTVVRFTSHHNEIVRTPSNITCSTYCCCSGYFVIAQFTSWSRVYISLQARDHATTVTMQQSYKWLALSQECPPWVKFEFFWSRLTLRHCDVMQCLLITNRADDKQNVGLHESVSL